MKIIKAFILVLLSFGVSQAQDNISTSMDMITLNNGDEFIGTITEYVQDQYVIIQTTISTPLRFELTTVKQVKQGIAINRSEERVPFAVDKFYYSAGLGGIVSSEKNYGLHANAGVVRQFNRWLGLGAGISYTDYSRYYENMERMAVYGSYRAYFRDEFISPYTEINLGYGFTIHDFEEFQTEFRNGLYANPKFGIRFASSGVMWTIHVGASIQHTDSELIENEWGSWQQDRILKRTELGFGLLF